ncbi:MAG: hypothetical protein H0W72_11450 [Planctomycetes bacterium]|nr:hypothetical protein [Planctomycetota bacterium]
MAGAVQAETIGRQLVDQYPITAWNSPTYGLTYLPPSYANSTAQYPLIIFLHGAGEVGDGVAGLNNLLGTALPQKIAQGWNPQAVNPIDGRTYEFIVVSPQAPSASRWSYSYAHLQHILRDVQARYRVDPARVYVTGVSAGGAGTWSTVTNNDATFAAKIAAILPVSAAGTNTGAEEANIPGIGGTGVNVWTICGANDAWMAKANQFVGMINGGNPPPAQPAVATGIPGADHTAAAWNAAYDPNWRSNVFNLSAYEWLLRSKRGAALSNTAPTISPIGDRTISAGGSTGAIAFTVGDTQTAATALVVTASSSNPTLVPAANVVLGGSGADRTVTITPAAGQSGSATITVSVSDGSLSAARAFALTVNAVAATGDVTVRVDFGPAAVMTSGTGWNGIPGYSAGHGVANAVDSTGAGTALDIAITRNFVWAADRGVASSALYPQTAQRGWVASDLTTTGAITISDLDPAKTYDLVFFGSSINDAWVSRYTVGSRFVTLDANNNTSRTATLADLVPTAGGTLVVSVTAESGGTGCLNVLEIRSRSGGNPAPPPPPTPDPATGDVTLLVDFGPASLATPGNWNNVSGHQASPGVVNAIATNGTRTAVSIAITQGFVWSDGSGVASSALYPQTAQQGWVASNQHATGKVTIGNLDPAKSYDLVFFGSRIEHAWIARYTVGSAFTTLDARNNTKQTATLRDLVPTSNGTLTLTVTADSGETGCLNVMEIRSHAPSAPVSNG